MIPGLIGAGIAYALLKPPAAKEEVIWHNVGGDMSAPALVLLALRKGDRVSYQLHLIDQGNAELVAIDDNFPAAIATLQTWARWSAENGQTRFPDLGAPGTQYLPTRDLRTLTTRQIGPEVIEAPGWSQIIQVPGL